MKFDGWPQRHFGKPISRYGYRLLTRRIGEEDIYFLNFGYEEDPPMGLVLDPSCGNGGAASYITRTMHPRS